MIFQKDYEKMWNSLKESMKEDDDKSGIILMSYIENQYNHDDEKLQKIMNDYKENDVVMSELLRSPEYSDMLDNDEKQFLLQWAGDSAFVEVDNYGKIEPINKEES